MTIWLVDKSIEDLMKIPLLPGERLINIRPNLDNEAYVVDNLIIHYEIKNAIPELSKFGGNIADVVGCAIQAEHTFRNKNKQIKKLKFWEIDIWNAVPKKFREPVFYHELIEIQCVEKGIKQPEGHETAVRETDKYIEKYLGEKEKKHFKEMFEKLRNIKLTEEDIEYNKRIKTIK